VSGGSNRPLFEPWGVQARVRARLRADPERLPLLDQAQQATTTIQTGPGSHPSRGARVNVRDARERLFLVLLHFWRARKQQNLLIYYIFIRFR